MSSICFFRLLVLYNVLLASIISSFSCCFYKLSLPKIARQPLSMLWFMESLSPKRMLVTVLNVFSTCEFESDIFKINWINFTIFGNCDSWKLWLIRTFFLCSYLLLCVFLHEFKTLPLPQNFWFLESRPCQWCFKMIYQEINQISESVLVFPIFFVHKFHSIVENEFLSIITKPLLYGTMKLRKNISFEILSLKEKLNLEWSYLKKLPALVFIFLVILFFRKWQFKEN